jgi:uncharacterized protein YraI
VAAEGEAVRGVALWRVIENTYEGRRLYMKPINVGLLGIGTVGGGTFKVLQRNQEEITRRAGRGRSASPWWRTSNWRARSRRRLRR